MRKETAAEKELCGLHLKFTGSYFFRGDFVEEIEERGICDLVIFFSPFLNKKLFPSTI